MGESIEIKVRSLIFTLQERVKKYTNGINNHEGNIIYLKAKLAETEDILKHLKKIL